MFNVSIVFLGAGLGGASRYAVGVIVASVGFASPFATLAVNILGSLLMGITVGLFGTNGGTSVYWHTFLATGVLGGFTTFSTFSLDTVQLVRDGDERLAVFYICVSVMLSIGALFLGLFLTKQALSAAV